jgi:hypothetical protein
VYPSGKEAEISDDIRVGEKRGVSSSSAAPFSLTPFTSRMVGTWDAACIVLGGDVEGSGASAGVWFSAIVIPIEIDAQIDCAE